MTSARAPGSPADGSPADGATAPRATIVVAPRERFGWSRASLVSVLAHTPRAMPLVYVAAGMPPDLVTWLGQAATQHGFTLVRHDGVLTPNRARNLGLAHVRTRYAICVDNDVEATPGWAEALVRCADETGARAVGPLYLEGPPEAGVVHMAGGFLERAPAPRRGRRRAGDVLHMPHRHHGRRLAEVAPALRCEPCDYVEFHAMLVDVGFVRAAGGLDEGLWSVHEHVDLGLRIAAAGGRVWFEPASVVAYRQPPPWEPADLGFFLQRWSDEWNRASVRRFDARWDVETGVVLDWARGFRRRLLRGLVLPSADAPPPASPAEHAAVMLAVLEAAGHGVVEVVARDAAGRRLPRRRRGTTGALAAALPSLLAAGAGQGRRLMVRASHGDAGAPALVVVRARDAAARARVAPLACLLVQAADGVTEAWVPVAHGARTTSLAPLCALLAGTAADVRGEGMLAGSADGGRRASIVAACGARAAAVADALAVPPRPRWTEAVRALTRRVRTAS